MMLKRTCSLLLCLVMLLSIAPAGSLLAAAESEAPQVLYDLMKKFPHKAYWNHVGSPQNNPDGVTDTPCPTHAGCSWTEGACTCNSFAQAIQCMGFAYKAAFDIVGSNPREWEQSNVLDASKLRVGDIIRYRGNRHSLCVTGVKGNRISFVDCNWYPMCQIRWDAMDLDDMPSFSYVLHDPKNHLKNKNLDFYQSMVENADAFLQLHLQRDETWNSTAVMNLRKKVSTDSAVVTQIPAGTNFVVTDKRLKNNYLWGKTSYGSANGWVALDHCTYLHGNVNAPQFTDPSDVQPAGTAFTLSWNAVACADYYKVFVYDADDKCVAKTKTKALTASFTLPKTGACYAEVQSFSKRVPSWILTSAPVSFTVMEPADIEIREIKLNQTQKTLQLDATDALSITLTPYCANRSALRFSSDDSNVVEIDALGNLLAVGYGKTSVSVKDETTGISAVCLISVLPDAPQQVRQLKSKIASDAVTLKWDKVPKADGYYVYRRNASGKYKLVATTVGNVFTDTPLSNAKEFAYVVKAFFNTENGPVAGLSGAPVTAVTKPNKIETIRVEEGKGTLTLKWEKNSRADYYIVYQYSSALGRFEKIASVEKNVYRVKIESGKKAYFKVRAVKTVQGKNYASVYSAKVKGIAK